MFPSLVRALLLGLAGLFLVGGVVALAFHVPAFGLLVFGVVLLVGVAFERWRYKPVEETPGAGFEPTGERFLDPASGEPVRVYSDPTSGERRYVRDGARP